MAEKKIKKSSWWQDISNYVGGISLIKNKPKISIDPNVHRIIDEVKRGNYEQKTSFFRLAHAKPAYTRAASAGKSSEESHKAGTRAANKALGKKGTATNTPEYRKISLSYNKQHTSGTTIGSLFFKPRLSGLDVGAFAQQRLNNIATINSRRSLIDAIGKPFTSALEAILHYGPHNLNKLYHEWKSSVKSEFFSSYRKEIQKQVLIDAQAIYRKTGAEGLKEVLTKASHGGVHTAGEAAAHLKGLQLSLAIRQRVITNATLAVVGTVAAAYLGNRLYQAYKSSSVGQALDAATSRLGLGKGLTTRTRRPRIDRATWNKNISIGRRNSPYVPERTEKPKKTLLGRAEINRRISVGLKKSHALKNSGKIK